MHGVHHLLPILQTYQLHKVLLASNMHGVLSSDHRRSESEHGLSVLYEAEHEDRVLARSDETERCQETR